MIRKTPFLRINLQFSQIRLTEALTFIVFPLSRYAEEHLHDSSRGASDIRHNLHDRMQTPGFFSIRISTNRMSATELSATPQPTHRKEELADRSQTDPGTDSARNRNETTRPPWSRGSEEYTDRSRQPSSRIPLIPLYF